jgi:hypothetical protein
MMVTLCVCVCVVVEAGGGVVELMMGALLALLACFLLVA